MRRVDENAGKVGLTFRRQGQVVFPPRRGGVGRDERGYLHWQTVAGSAASARMSRCPASTNLRSDSSRAFATIRLFWRDPTRVMPPGLLAMAAPIRTSPR